MFNYYLKDLPPFGKLFVGLFTALMLFVCLWAVFIFYVENGMYTEDEAIPLYLQQENEAAENNEHEEGESQLRHNLGLAHTHINGQTLLFFALGLVFLFTSVNSKTKKLALSVFGVAVFVHAVGLSGQHYHWFFDDILAVSGVALLVVIPYICFMIFVDLFKKSSYSHE